MQSIRFQPKPEADALSIKRICPKAFEFRALRADILFHAR